MAFVLPRFLVLVLLWGLTCTLMALMGPVTAAACYLAAGCWALIGIFYLIYVRRLRLESPFMLRQQVFDYDNLS